MRMIRNLTLSVIAAAITVPAMAQFDGPAPLSWRFQASMGQATGSPLVDGDTVYYPNGGRMVALDRETGNKRWQYPQVERIAGMFKGSPVLFNGSVVSAADNKTIYAIDAKGQTKWTYNSSEPIVGQICSSGRYIVFELSGSKIMAIDGNTGLAGGGAWETPYANGSGMLGGIATNGNDVLFFNYRSELVSLDITTRKANWVVPLVSVAPASSPVVANGLIVINCGTAIVALSAETHRLRWQKVVTEQLSFSPAVSSEAVFAVSVEGNVYGWDISGTPLSKKPVTLGGTLGAVRPLAVGRKVIVPSTNGIVNLVDVEAGSILWSYVIRPTAEYAAALGATRTGSSGSPAGGGPAGGGPGSGPGGISRGSTQVEAVVTVQASATPTLSGVTLLVPSRDGSLLAFDKTTGVDLTAPKVTLVFPNPGDQVSPKPPLQLWIKIEDDASGVDISSIKIEIDGVKMDAKMERDGTAVVRFSESGKNRLLSDGRKDIVVTVSDYLGNVRMQKFALTIDNTLAPVKLPGTTAPNGGFGGPPGGAGKGGGGGNGSQGGVG